MKCLLSAIVISIPAYLISNSYTEYPTSTNFSYDSLVNAMLTLVAVGLFGVLNAKELKQTNVSSAIGAGIILSGFVFFISIIQLYDATSDFTIIILCFIITPIYGLIDLAVKENEKDHTS